MVSLGEAVMTGLAPDGGLFMPEHIPVIPRAFFNNIGEMNIREIAYVVADLMLGDDIDSSEIQRMVNETFTFEVPLVEVHDSVYALELFHGPTHAFKDVGARFLARIIGHYGCMSDNRNVKVIVATSGDSGAAVANGFLDVPGVDVYILYPQGCLTQLQRAGLSISDSNIHPVEVLGTFDDCQRMVKEVFMDRDLCRETLLTSANSINICRLLPQMFYFFHGYASLVHSDRSNRPVVMSVPCGNLGNLTAGLLARKMGLPVDRFVIANNRNDVTAEYLRTGLFKPTRAIRTVACAMDVGNPSNMSRILDLFKGDYSEISGVLRGYSFSDMEIINAISETHFSDRYLLDPHGATAFMALKKDLGEGERGVFLATAHPSKFSKVVTMATGVKLDSMANATSVKIHHPRISASSDALKKLLVSLPGQV